MIALIDSNIIAATFRRSNVVPLRREHALQLIYRDELRLIGNVRQEARSGVASVKSANSLDPYSKSSALSTPAATTGLSTIAPKNLPLQLELAVLEASVIDMLLPASWD